MTTIYRNYSIARLGDKFVAKSSDDDCLLISTDQRRLHSAIDALWDSLEMGIEPNWFAGSTAIDLDSFGPESAPSSSDPPTKVRKISCPLFLASAVAVSAPLSYFMEIEKAHARIDVLLTIGVCAVAVAFGKKFALMATFVATIVFNFFAVEPLLSFTVPTFDEAILFLMNLIASWGIPELLKLRDWLGTLVKDRTPGT
ncbi:DUF4118 domain-containing protein [Bradyrhizobium hipponense]|nr:DUF4118 domain-containing protein [Bradyrhizobium hipponense]